MKTTTKAPVRRATPKKPAPLLLKTAKREETPPRITSSVSIVGTQSDVDAAIEAAHKAVTGVTNANRTPARQKGEFTPQEYATKMGLQGSTARAHLLELVRQGKLQRRRVVLNTVPAFYYSAIK